jgi:hypothetical protein
MIDDKIMAQMDAALEQACRALPNGGDHESRKYVAKELRRSAEEGNTTMEGLSALADRLVRELSRQRSA